MCFSCLSNNKCWKWLQGSVQGKRVKPVVVSRRSSTDKDEESDFVYSYYTRLFWYKRKPYKSDCRRQLITTFLSPVLPPFFAFLPMHIFSFHILFCLIYLFFPSPWPSFLPILCSFSQCVDRKRGLRWVWAHQRGVYCPNLRELALKTKSRASETMEGFTGGRGSKTGPDWVVYLFSVEERGCQQAMWWPGGWGEGWSGLSDWCRAAPIPPIVPYAPHHVSLTYFLNGRNYLIRYSRCRCRHFCISKKIFKKSLLKFLASLALNSWNHFTICVK